VFCLFVVRKNIVTGLLCRLFKFTWCHSESSSDKEYTALLHIDLHLCCISDKKPFSKCISESSPCLSFDSRFLWRGISSGVTGRGVSKVIVPAALIGLGGWTVGSLRHCTIERLCALFMCLKALQAAYLTVQRMKTAACGVNQSHACARRFWR